MGRWDARIIRRTRSPPGQRSKRDKMESALDLKWPFAKRYLDSRSWPIAFDCESLQIVCNHGENRHVKADDRPMQFDPNPQCFSKLL
jgi:hypothetical protein